MLIDTDWNPEETSFFVQYCVCMMQYNLHTVYVCEQGELKGKKGLVPSNFLEEFKEEEEAGERERRKSKRKSTGGLSMEIFAASEQDMEQAKRIIAEVSSALLYISSEVEF